MVSFITPVSYANIQNKSYTNALIEFSDRLFDFGQQKAYVIPGAPPLEGKVQVALQNDSSPYIYSAFKIAIYTVGLISTSLILSYYVMLIPTTLLAIKVVSFYTRNFEVIDNTIEEVERNLTNNLNISQTDSEYLDEKIQRLMAKILQGEDDNEIHYFQKLGSDSSAIILGLKSDSEEWSPLCNRLVFKIASSGNLEKRFKNLKKAKQVCISNNLDRLSIPNAKISRIADRSILIMDRLRIAHSDRVQEHLYSTLPDLNEPIKQITTLVAKTGFSDVAYRNIPIVNSGNRPNIGIIDFEEMDGAKTGIFGSGLRDGLISCVSKEEHLDTIISEVNRQGIYGPRVDQREGRLEAGREYQRLLEYYEKNGLIENPKKPVEVENLESLGLNLKEEQEIPHFFKKVNKYSKKEVFPNIITLEYLANMLIEDINRQIANANEQESVKGQRSFELDITTYMSLGFNEDRDFDMEREEIERRSWAYQILNTLVDKGHLFKIETQHGCLTVYA